MIVEVFLVQVLGVEGMPGRFFEPADSAPGAPRAIIIGWDLFQRRFGGDHSIIGRSIELDEPHVVVGVLPKGFRLLLPPDAAVPDHLQVFAAFWPV